MFKYITIRNIRKKKKTLDGGYNTGKYDTSLYMWVLSRKRDFVMIGETKGQ